MFTSGEEVGIDMISPLARAYEKEVHNKNIRALWFVEEDTSQFTCQKSLHTPNMPKIGTSSIVMLNTILPSEESIQLKFGIYGKLGW